MIGQKALADLLAANGYPGPHDKRAENIILDLEKRGFILKGRLPLDPEPYVVKVPGYKPVRFKNYTEGLDYEIPPFEIPEGELPPNLAPLFKPQVGYCNSFHEYHIAGVI